MKHPTVKGIIFDLDGTLIDSLDDLTESVNYALTRQGLKPYHKDEVKYFVGNGMKSLIQHAINRLVEDQIIKKEESKKLIDTTLELFLEHYEKQCIQNTTAYYGVEEFLNQFKDQYKFAVLTNKSEYFTNKILTHLNLKDYLTHVLTGDVEIYKKPNPDGILKIQKDWGFKNHEILMMGDHYTDIQSAKSANVKSIFAIYGYGRLEGLKPDFSIKHFSLLKHLLNLFYAS